MGDQVLIGFYSELEKIGASVLRRSIKVIPSRRGYVMLHDGKPIGEATMSNKAKGTIQSISIVPEFQGMGLGKKFYGEIARLQPGGVLKSDSLLSPKAVRTWKSMSSKRPGTIVQSPYTKKTRDFVDDDMTTEGTGATFKHPRKGSLSDSHPNRSVFKMTMPEKAIREGVPKSPTIQRLLSTDPKVTWERFSL